MIAQEIAISFPQRVRSLTSIMSTTGNPKMPPPTREATAMLMAPPTDHQGRIFRALCPDLEGSARRQLSRGRGARSRPRRAQLRARPQSGRRRTAAARHPGLRQPQGAAALGQGADAGDSRHRRSAGAPRGRQGYRGLDPRRQAADDRRHGPRAADPDVAADHRRDRQACPRRRREGSALRRWARENSRTLEGGCYAARSVRGGDLAEANRESIYRGFAPARAGASSDGA